MKEKTSRPAQVIVDVMQRIYQQGLTTTSGGNLSVLDEDGCIWITPAGTDKGSMTADDIVCVRPDGTWEGKLRPSSELPFHTAIYRARPDLRAVLHAHSPNLMSFAVVGRVPDLALLPDLRRSIGEAKMAPYAIIGSSGLAKSIQDVFATGCNTALMENHGVCVGAKDLFSAFRLFEMLEYAAGVELIAGRVGKFCPVNTPSSAYEPLHWPAGTFEADALEAAARSEMVKFIRRGYRLGLLASTQGSVSAKLPDGSFLVTPSAGDLAEVTEDDLVRVKDGCAEEGKLPSRTAELSQEIYRANPEVGAVLYCRPRFTMGYAVTDTEIDMRTIPETDIVLHGVSYHPYGTDAKTVAEAMKPFSPAAIIRNGAVVVTGKSLLQAFDRVEVLELTARSLAEAPFIGKVEQLTEDKLQELAETFHLPD